MAQGMFGLNRAMRRDWRGKWRTRTRFAEDDEDETDFRNARLVAKKLRAYREKQVTPNAPQGHTH